MTWKNKPWNPRAQEWKQAWEKEDKEKVAKKGKETEKEKSVVYAHDGRKLALPMQGASGNGSSSASSTSQEELKQLREAVKFFAGQKEGESEEVPDAYKKFVVENPRDVLREQQKELNRQKKSLTRIEKLQASIADKEESYAAWKNGYLEMIQQEDKRHAEEMKQLHSELKEVEKGGDVMEDAEPPTESAMKQELDQMKAQFAQMNYYFHAMEPKNQSLVGQMQALVQTLRENQQSDPGALSPQHVVPPKLAHPPELSTGEMELWGTPGVKRDRSRSPCKAHPKQADKEALEAVTQATLAQMLHHVPTEHHATILAMIQAEPQNYQTTEQVEILGQQVMAQIDGPVDLGATKPPGPSDRQEYLPTRPRRGCVRRVLQSAPSEGVPLCMLCRRGVLLFCRWQ